MILSAKTDIGAYRETNQDAFQCGMFSDGSTWAIVCDGMGGVSGGQVASSICVERIASAFSKGYRKGASLKSIKNLMQSAISSANASVFSKAQDETQLKGMGTTVVAVIINKGIAVIAHVGDSRAYLIGDEITRITKDHSLVEFMLDTGRITQEEAKIHPDRNVITRAVGIENFVDTDIDVVDVSDKDKILICTDGLSGVIDDDRLMEIIKTEEVFAADKLIAEALKNGSHDNITAVLIDGNQGE